MIYFDNAATSWPKPSVVTEAMTKFLNETGANPGRAGHRLSIESSRIVYNTREAVSELFNNPDPLRVAFTKNITESLNITLYGLLKPGDHVITSSMEHNSMMRPLRDLEQQGIELTVVNCSSQGLLSPDDIKQAIKKNTTLIAINHVSNVTGTIQPISEIGNIAREHNLLFLIDAAQSAGVLEIDMEKSCIDLLGFTGHKSLYGPMGTGGLIIGERVDETSLNPLLRGGTGSRSPLEKQPGFLPDLLESGTPNVIGLAGLLASIHWIQQKGISAIHRHETVLTKKLLSGLQTIPEINIIGLANAEIQTATVSFTINILSPSEVGLLFDEEYDILCRVGLHCSPSSHKTTGTFPDGTIRFGFGIFNTEDEVTCALEAIKNMITKTR